MNLAKCALEPFLLYFLILPFFSSDGDDDNGNSTADTTSSEKSDLAASEVANNAMTANATSSADGKPVHKWPIRPGVHVHVNGLHMLNNSTNSGEQISGFTYGARNNSSVSDTASEKDRGCEESEVEKITVARGTSTSDMAHDDPATASMASNKKTIASETAHNNSNALIIFSNLCHA